MVIRSCFLLLAFFLITSTWSQKKFDVSDSSLRINADQFDDVCDCVNAQIQYLKDLLDLYRTGQSMTLSHADSIVWNDLYMARTAKADEFLRHCKPMYEANRSDIHKCPNYKEGGRLERQLIELKKSMGLR